MFRSLALFLLAVACSTTMADEKLKGIACRSVHLGYDAPKGNAFYNEMTVDTSADGTYFMACGWNKGYFGIQELANGKKLVIFSVWDPNSGEDPKKVPDEKRVKMQHKDDAVRVGRFGNEGTGGQSFLDFDWKIGTTYRFLVTSSPDPVSINKAEEILNLVLKTEPNADVLNIMMAMIRHVQGNYEEEVRLYRKALERRPEESEGRCAPSSSSTPARHSWRARGSITGSSALPPARR